MKYFFIAIAFCFFFRFKITAQVNCGKDSIMYLAAYNYIANDLIKFNPGKSIVVSDSIVDLDRYWFLSDLIAFPLEKEKIEQYRIRKGFRWLDTFYSSCLNFLFPKKDGLAKGTIFFSSIEDLILRADFLPCKENCTVFDERFNYTKMAFQNIGRIYLFIFNTNGTIKAVFDHEITYE